MSVGAHILGNVLSGSVQFVARIAACALAVTWLTCCQNDTMVNLDDRKCQASGGKVVYGIIGEVCAMPTSDTGKVCNDISQCEGLCLSNGTCSEWDNNFGCTDVLVEGEPVTICID